MRQHAAALLEDALSLPEQERAEVAGALLNSLEPLAESGVEEAWREEVADRVRALEAGEVELTSWSEVRERFWARLGARNRA